MCSQEEEGGLLAAKKVGDRLLMWGLFIGIVLGGLQFLAIPLLGFFTPIKAVQEAARVPAMLAAAQQVVFLHPPTKIQACRVAVLIGMMALVLCGEATPHGWVERRTN